jgi:S-adenosylmethionine decarboxylase
MAYDDALFQLGMDLTRSSTAQKEDHGEIARVACVDASSESAETASALPGGHHLIIDLYDGLRLDEVEHIERTLRRCARAAGAVVLHVHLHRATPANGVAGIGVIADGHISIHTRPATGYAAVDIYLRASARPHACVEVLKQAFATRDVEVRAQRRGMARRSVGWAGDEVGAARAAGALPRQRAKVKRAA